MTRLVERLREKACAYVGDIYDDAADALEFPWERWYRKEHDDLCHIEARNYVMEKALREIATRAYETGHELQVIARKALGEEAVEKTLMEEVAELRAVFNGTLGEE